MSYLEWVAYLSIIFNRLSPCFSLPAVKPSPVQMNLAFSSLDAEVTGLEVEDAVV